MEEKDHGRAEQFYDTWETAEDSEETAWPTEENDGLSGAEKYAKYVEEQKQKKRGKFLKFLAAAIIAIAVGFLVFALVRCSSGDDSSDGSKSSASTYVNPYVTLVKTTRNSTYGITYGAAFDSFFTSPEWSYFKATTGEHVVEFEGYFLYDGARAKATVQFVLDTSEGTMTVYHLSINGQGQSRLMLSALVKKVFESY